MISKKKKTVFTDFETDFSAAIGNSNFFSAQFQVISKKIKKKKKVFTDFETDFSAEIGNSNVFSAQFQVISKKKLRGAVFRWGGLFSIFHQKSASKAPKTCDFAYFTSQWGGLSPPTPPGYATAPLRISGYAPDL